MIDYSSKMPDLDFHYESDPEIGKIPDPQVNPILPGARIPLRKVGIAPVELPIIVKRREGGIQLLQAQASLYCSLDDPNAKGLNLSRLYLIMHERIKDHLSLDGIESTLRELAKQQGSKNAFCKLRFKYPWTQGSLRSGLRGHITYQCILEGTLINGKVKFFLTVKYVYSSTCPCSFELAYDARVNRGKAANAHSQRSVMTVKIEFRKDKIVWIEDLVELLREHIPTEVQVVVKRLDEQAFAELNGSNLLFSEDAVRIVYGALDFWYGSGQIQDFSILTEHMESLHPWNAIAVASKFDPAIVPGCLC